MSAPRWFHCVCAIALAAVVGPSVRADDLGADGLREVAGRLAEGVRKAAGKLEQPAVRIGFFSPFGIDDSHSGGAFMAELAASLKKFVNPDAALELQGSYGFIEDPEKPGLKAIVVRAKLVRLSTGADEKEFTPFEGFIRADSDIARLLGANVDFTDAYDREKRNKELQDGLPPGPHKPPIHTASIHGRGDTLVSPAKDSLYSVQIRTLPLADFGKREASARQAELVNGEPFVEIEKGELYEVRILNYSDRKIAVTLAIDGIDRFTFSDDRDDEGRPKYHVNFVDQAKDGSPGETTIRGWHKKKDLTDEDRRQGKKNVLSFLVTEYGKGAASKFPTQSQGKVGTITVAFCNTFLRPTSSGPLVGATETGFGPPIDVKQTTVDLEYDNPSAFVTVRYSR